MGVDGGCKELDRDGELGAALGVQVIFQQLNLLSRNHKSNCYVDEESSKI